MMEVPCFMEETSPAFDDLLSLCSARDGCEAPGEESPFEVDDKDEISLMISAVEQRHKNNKDRNSMKVETAVVKEEEAKMEADATGNPCNQVTRFNGQNAKEHALRYLTQLCTNCNHITINIACNTEPGQATPGSAEENNPNKNGTDTKENSLNQNTSKPKKTQIRKKRKLNKRKRPKGEYKCDVCRKIYTYASNLSRHRASHSKSYDCEQCGTTFKRKDYLKEHLLKSKKCKSTSVIVLQ